MTDLQRERERLLMVRRDELLTVKEFAAVTREHVKSVRRRISQGRQPGAVRIGGQWRIDLACCLLRSGSDSQVA